MQPTHPPIHTLTATDTHTYTHTHTHTHAQTSLPNQTSSRESPSSLLFSTKLIKEPGNFQLTQFPLDQQNQSGVADPGSISSWQPIKTRCEPSNSFLSTQHNQQFYSLSLSLDLPTPRVKVLQVFASRQSCNKTNSSAGGGEEFPCHPLTLSRGPVKCSVLCSVNPVTTICVQVCTDFGKHITLSVQLSHICDSVQVWCGGLITNTRCFVPSC